MSTRLNMSPRSRRIAPWTMAALGLMAAYVLPATTGRGMVIISDDEMITDPQQRADLTKAVETLNADPADLPSLELLLRTFPHVVRYGNPTVNMADPLKAAACQQLLGKYSIAVLVQTLTNGSDLAAQWASLRIICGGMKADDAGAIIDAAAHEKLKEPLLAVLKRKDPAARAAAVQAFSAVYSKDDLPKVVKPLLQDADAPVRAAAIRQLVLNYYFDGEVDKAVQKALTDSNDPEVLAAGCVWWWVVRGRHDKTITPEQEAMMIRRSADSHAEVRREVAEAVGDYTTPDHPELVKMLISLADSDADEIVRSRAVFSLRNVRTVAVHNKLLEWSKDPKSASVRQDAQRLLDEYNWNYPFLKP